MFNSVWGAREGGLSAGFLGMNRHSGLGGEKARNTRGIGTEGKEMKPVQSNL